MIGKKVILIDDDNDLLQLTSYIFKSAGAEVIIAHDGTEGIGKILTHRPNLILLDIHLPGFDGFEVCKIIRQISNAPLIILTASDLEENHVQAMELGADDFVVKPFAAAVLLARANAILRRSGIGYENEHPIDPNYNDGRLMIDNDRRQILINGKQVKSGPTEFRLLTYLLRNVGKAITHNQLLANVWGEEYRGNIDILQVYISNLRHKIEEDPKEPRYIRVVHGYGYIFERQDSILSH
jgi:two-component system KDP operon response regulator KdpE